MKLLSKLLLCAMMASAVPAANSQQLGEAFVINPYPADTYQSFLSAVTVTWNFNIITLVDYEEKIPVSINGKTYEVYADVYFDPEIAWELGQTNSDLAWGNELIIDFSEEAYACGYPTGEYTIMIPEGFVMDDEGNFNESQIIEFIKVDPVEPLSITPADGIYPAENLTDVKITFSEPFTYLPGAGDITVRPKDDWLNPAYVITPSGISDDGKTLNLDLSTLERGILYTVNIPAGYLLIGEYNINKEIWLEYMNWDGMAQATILSAPDPETSPELSPFILTWDYQPIAIPEDAPDTEFVCGFPDYGLQEGWRIFIPADYYQLVYAASDGSIMTPSLENPANALYLNVSEFTKDFPGYRFEIFFPAGLVLNDRGLDNPPLNYVFTVWELLGQPEFAAEGGIITVEWPDTEWITYNLSDNDPFLLNEEGQKFNLEFTFGGTVPGQIWLENENKHLLIIDLNDLDLPNGSYILTIPQGYVILEQSDGEGVFNGETTYSFHWLDGDFSETGFIKTGLKDSVYRVFSITGMKIMETEDISSVRNLPEGVYIINGRKFLKRN